MCSEEKKCKSKERRNEREKRNKIVIFREGSTHYQSSNKTIYN